MQVVDVKREECSTHRRTSVLLGFNAFMHSSRRIVTLYSIF